MACKSLAVALGMIIAASPVVAAQPESMPAEPAPAAGPAAKYCLRVMPRTGSLIERVQCWTREDWTAQGVDVDREWAEEGVAVIDETGTRTFKG
jgi:hypothetical protein